MKNIWSIIIFFAIASLLPFYYETAIAEERAVPPPILLVGNIHSSNKVTFVWSHGCETCSEEFRVSLFPAYLEAALKKDMLFSFLEFEESDLDIKTYTAPAICGGKAYYNLYVLGNIVNRLSIPDLRKLARQHRVKFYNCSNQSEVEGNLKLYFSGIKHKFPEIDSRHGFVIINGKVQHSSDAVKRFLDRM